MSKIQEETITINERQKLTFSFFKNTVEYAKVV